MDDFDTAPGGAVGGGGARGAVFVGYVMLVLAIGLLLIMAIDDGPEVDDYDDSEEFMEAVESHQSRSEFYPACMGLLLMGGLIVISGGLVQSGLDDSYVHPYIRIAVIIAGVLLLVGLVELLAVSTLVSAL